jgi:hypothetical protein
MTYSEPAQVAAVLRKRSAKRRAVPHGRIMRPSHLVAAAAVALGVTAAGCSGGPPATGPLPAATAAPAGGSSSSGSTPLAQAVAYSQCIRSHGVSDFPDPVLTPSGGYGYRTNGIDPNSSAFQGALQACKNLPSPWNSTGQQLSASQQQAWLNWAQCVRAHGVPNFPDPTFSGSEVHDPGVGSASPQLQQAMDACKSQLPSTGGLGG